MCTPRTALFSVGCGQPVKFVVFARSVIKIVKNVSKFMNLLNFKRQDAEFSLTHAAKCSSCSFVERLTHENCGWRNRVGNGGCVPWVGSGSWEPFPGSALYCGELDMTEDIDKIPFVTTLWAEWCRLLPNSFARCDTRFCFSISDVCTEAC